MAKSDKTYFLRQSTGLIREWNVTDVFMYLVLTFNVPIFLALAYTQGGWMDPGASLPLATIFVAIGTTFLGIMYSMLIASMPRSGGDYVFNSRILHPVIGMMTGVNFTVIWQMVWNILMSQYFANAVLGPWFTTLGVIFHNESLLATGAWFLTIPAILTIMIALYLVNIMMHVVGLRNYAKFQYLMFAFMCISFILIVGVPLSIGHLGWVNNFNTLVGSPDAYSKVISTAVGYGFEPTKPFSLSGTLLLMPLPYGALLAVYWIAENAGEIKEAGSLKANLTHILGSNVFGAVIIIATSLALVSVIGQDFLSSLGYLFFTGKPEYMLAQPPYAYFLASIASNNSIIISLIFFGLLISGVQISYNTVLAGSRNLMAASFDRIFFEKAAHVSERFHMPTYSVLAMYIIPMILTPVYLFTGFGTMLLGATMANAILFISTSVSAIILPWRRPEIYRASPASKYSVAGIPAISIIGAINLIFNLTVASIIFTTPAYGLVNLPSQVFLAATFLLWIPVYYGFRWYRAKQGINVDLAFKEIPPE